MVALADLCLSYHVFLSFLGHIQAGWILYSLYVVSALVSGAISGVTERLGLIRCSPLNLGLHRTNKQDFNKKITPKYIYTLTYKYICNQNPK